MCPWLQKTPTARGLLGLFALLPFFYCSDVGACGDGYYEKTLSFHGHVVKRFCIPNSRTDIAIGTLTGPTLAKWIKESRNSARNGAQPIPPEMRELVEGYAPDKVLDRARYRIGDNGIVNLARASEHIGDAAAVTLDYVIVFKNSDYAENPGIWVHELTHVDQYAQKGVDEFANEYVTNYKSIENPAYAAEDNYWNSIQNQSPPASESGDLEPGWIAAPCGCYGPVPTVRDEPRCTSGKMSPVLMFCNDLCPSPTGSYQSYHYRCQ